MPQVAGKLQKADGSPATQSNHLDFWNIGKTSIIASLDTASDGGYALGLATGQYYVKVNTLGWADSPSPLVVLAVPLVKNIKSGYTL